MTDTLHPALRHLLFDVTLGSAVARDLGITLVSASPDVTVLAMPFRPRMLTFGDVIHGGVIATRIDIAGAAAFVAGADPSLKGGATSGMTISYLAPARSVDLVATARVLRRGRSQTVSEIEVTGADRLVAKAICTNSGF
ncbi:PaaI family thioesterase [Enterovirga sp. CN4-39]|uniref:PaaI family thioesterase n=1 Tax=Enterovirga sp. CN4-39 TaxID=3400910 RepID=UPI003BFFAC93